MMGSMTIYEQTDENGNIATSILALWRINTALGSRTKVWCRSGIRHAHILHHRLRRVFGNSRT
jgi:hypothetical protein